ncbi:peptidase S49 [Burkholderia ubonensis]|uniref:Peptidase S49 n=1 Tax=Burkholderia ubonensis TaxID=101571 RepID=A0A124RCU8_9BURK|nr:peptidase S49 [Burkholderia ubonensis]KVG71959.1 peptidase S49 [Burkholderia ubonensis]
MKLDRIVWAGLAASVLAKGASAQLAPPQYAGDAQRQQEQHLDAARRQVADTPDVLTPRAAAGASPLNLPAETPCIAIKAVEWRNAEAFPWLTKQSPGVGACVGTQGLAAIRQWLTGEMIARGYVTTLVGFPEQGVADGRLLIEVLPGRIGAIEDRPGGIGWTGGVFPNAPGSLLNVRDLDQALENVRRLPGQAATAFDLVPGRSLGTSEILVRHAADARRFTFALTFDNAGLNATGRNQIGAIAAVDSPLGLYDQLIATVNNDANPGQTTRGSRSRSVAWNVPFGYAAFSIGVSEWATRQPLDDLDGIVYERRTRRVEAGVDYVPYRTSHGKSVVRFRMVRREDRAWFGGDELLVQKHVITGYDVSIGHREKFRRASVEAGVGLRGSLTGLSAFPGYVAGQSNWSGRYRIASANVVANVPFEIARRTVGYRGTFVLQHAPGPIPSTEFMQIGGRYTVRGFDGNETLAGRGGWLARNELATHAFTGSEAYVALDAGQVWGDTYSAGRRSLAGGALGLRGGYKWLSYDVALGMPIRKPSALHSGAPTLDFRLTSRF